MEVAEALPGDYSSVGRSTSLDLNSLRNFCDLDHAQVGDDAKAQHGPASRAPNLAPSLSEPALKVASIGEQGHFPYPPPQPASPLTKWTKSFIKAASTATPSTGGIRAITAGGSGGRGMEASAAWIQPEPLDLEVLESPGSPTGARPSPCFASVGQNKPVFCEKARALSGRFCYPVNLAEGPELGRYDPAHRAVKGRNPAWDFGARQRHPTRKRPDDDDDDRRDPFRNMDMNSSTISGFSAASRVTTKEQMSLSMHRKALCAVTRTWRDPIQMNEAPDYAKEWHLQDAASSRRQRRPDWDFDKHTRGRTSDLRDTYFEAGKYETRWSAVEVQPKNGVDFSRSLGRTASTPAVLQSGISSSRTANSGGSEPVQPDRSLFRACPQTRPRVLDVREFSKGLARSSPKRPEYYDADDPAASAATLKAEQTFDASSADFAVIPRRDRAPSMARSLERGRAGHGARLFQEDNGIRMLHGIIGSQRNGATDDSKDTPPRAKKGPGFAFDHYKGRHPSRVNGKFSPLKMPRDMAAPQFSRKEPLPGFQTTCRLGALALQRSRAHEPVSPGSSRSSRCSGPESHATDSVEAP